MDMASFDEDRSSWIIEPGQYTIKVGASSKDIRSQEDFSVAKEMVVGKVSKALVPNRQFKRLTKETSL
jgi:beta-glucosidase